MFKTVINEEKPEIECQEYTMQIVIFDSVTHSPKNVEFHDLHEHLIKSMNSSGGVMTCNWL